MLARFHPVSTLVSICKTIQFNLIGITLELFIKEKPLKNVQLSWKPGRPDWANVRHLGDSLIFGII
jgi:hypothetical protein